MSSAFAGAKRGCILSVDIPTQTAWCAINHTIDGESASLVLDPAAGITTMRIEVKGIRMG